MEQVGVLGKLLAQLVVLLLPMDLLRQLGIALLDDLLQIAPRILQRLHREPGVRVRADVEALDLLVERGQRLEVDLGRRQRSLERGMCLPQRLDLLDRVAAHRIGQIFLRVLEPRVECRRLLGKRQIQILDLAELVLHVQQAVLARLRIGAQLLPARQHVLVALENGGRLGVVRVDQLILEGANVVDTLMLKRRET